MPEPQYKMGYYVVAFIDILGQKESLAKFQKLPNRDSTQEIEEFKKNLQETFGIVDSFRKSFLNFFQGFQERNQLFQQIPEQQAIYFKLDSNPIRFQGFGDSIIIFLSLRDSENKIPLRGLAGILNACGSIFLLFLSYGYPIRGGIDVGLAMEMYPGEIYGPAVSNAYKLENKIAQYPRIIIGGGLIEYLKIYTSMHEADIFTIINKRIAEVSLSLIAQDIDGYNHIDYLGPGFKPHIEQILGADVTRKAFEFVIKESNKWKSEKEQKLALRYTLLRDYFEARKNNIT